MKFTINEKYKLANIIFLYRSNKGYKNTMKRFSSISISALLYFILIILLLFYLLLFVFNLYVSYKILSNIIDTTVFMNNNEYEKYILTNFQCKNKLSVNSLDRFIELFRSDSSIKYFPSYFKPKIINYQNDSISILEYIYSQQFILSNSNKIQSINYIKNLEMLYNICYEYSNDIKWIISNNPIK